MQRRLMTLSLCMLAAASFGQMHKMQRGGAGFSAQDRMFAVDAAQGGRAEVEMGKVASNHGTSRAVTAFGDKMVIDHTEANQKLMRIIRNSPLVVPTGMNSEQMSGLQMLRGMKKGQRFDKTYSRMMLKDHITDVAAFEKEAKFGKNPQLRDFARTTLPTLREHLRMAQALPR